MAAVQKHFNILSFGKKYQKAIIHLLGKPHGNDKRKMSKRHMNRDRLLSLYTISFWARLGRGLQVRAFICIFIFVFISLVGYLMLLLLLVLPFVFGILRCSFSSCLSVDLRGSRIEGSWAKKQDREGGASCQYIVFA